MRIGTARAGRARPTKVLLAWPKGEPSNIPCYHSSSAQATSPEQSQRPGQRLNHLLGIHHPRPADPKQPSARHPWRKPAWPPPWRLDPRRACSSTSPTNETPPSRPPAANKLVTPPPASTRQVITASTRRADPRRCVDSTAGRLRPKKNPTGHRGRKHAYHSHQQARTGPLSLRPRWPGPGPDPHHHGPGSFTADSILDQASKRTCGVAGA